MTQTIDTPLKIESDGHVFTECPRWRDGSLYFSDIKGHRVHKLTPGGKTSTLVEIADEPSGLGFMPNDDLLIVSVHDAKLLRRAADGSVREHADLSGVARFGINDMVVDRAGRAYVAQFGYDTADHTALRPSPIIIVEPDGRVGTGPDGVMVANGMVLTPDGRTLIFAESAGGKVSAYDVGADGALSNRRTFAELPSGHFADGICLDAAGGVWVACCLGPGFIRVVEGGSVTHLLPMPQGRFGYACMLGGTDRRTLYLCTSERYQTEHLKACRTSRIESIPVDIAGVGLP